MSFKKSFVFLVLVLFLVACGSNGNSDSNQDASAGKKDNEDYEEKEVTFSDENDEWKVEMDAHLKKGKEERILTLTYTGDDPKSIDRVHYDVTGPEEFDGDKPLNGQHYLTDTEKSKGPLYTDEEDAQIEVSLEWNDESETFELEAE